MGKIAENIPNGMCEKNDKKEMAKCVSFAKCSKPSPLNCIFYLSKKCH